MEKNNLFPVFLKIINLDILLVGAGYVGAEKLTALLTNCPDANITVVAGYISDAVAGLAGQHSRVNLVQRNFILADLDKRDLVFLATDDPVLHQNIVTVTRKRRILTNVADTPDLCDFYLGSIVRKGNLKIGISTNGKSPTMAKRIRELLDEVIPENIDSLLENLQIFRRNLKGDFKEKVDTLNEFTRTFLEKDNKYDKIQKN
jgi:precorrin-2 dehydrogenase/sirohydrochlorin ferrochelatase